jgi:hypothetical protein
MAPDSDDELVEVLTSIWLASVYGRRLEAFSRPR